MPLLAAAATQSAPGPGHAWDVGQLMQEFKQVKAASGQFVERKTLKVLTEPLVSSGTLLYVAPDQLQKITVAPTRERLAVDRDKLTIEGGPEGRTRVFSLSDYPEIAVFVEGIRATLAGDLGTLARFYEFELAGSAEDWRLSLRPKDAKIRDLVKWIRIDGSDHSIRRVDTEQGDGGRSEMSIVEQEVR